MSSSKADVGPLASQEASTNDDECTHSSTQQASLSLTNGESGNENDNKPSSDNSVPNDDVKNSSQVTSSIPGKKRSAPQDTDNDLDASDGLPPSCPETKRSRSDREEVLDLTLAIGLKPGDRLEVEWEIGDESDSKPTETRWWGATLLEHDGRTEDTVAVRVIDYDPYPEGGFSERSLEDVIFLQPDTLVDLETHEEMRFRREGEGEEIWFNRSQLEEVVNATLTNAMQKNSQAWKVLNSAQQATVASTVASKKEKLLDLLTSHQGFLTSNDMRSYLAQAVTEE
jgi:hypothetical protein